MRWIIRILLLLIVVAAVAVGSLLMLPGERIARIAAEKISRLTGREVTIAGETRLSLWPVLGVATGPVRVANAEWGQGGPLFEAESLKIGVEPRALWGGDIRITGLEATGPVINLERAADGRVNWELGVKGVAPSGQTGAAGAPGAPGAPARAERLQLTLDRALITDASFRYTDHGSDRRTAMAGMDFDLRWPEIQGRATFDITLRPTDSPVRISGHVERLDDFIDGAPSAAEVTVGTRAGELRFAGRLRAMPEAEGRLEARLDDTGAFLAALGLPRPDIPPGLGRTLSAETALTLTGGNRLALRDLVLALDRGNRLTGGADLALGGVRPRLVARLAAGALDLSGSGGGGGAASAGGGAGAPAGTAGWSTAPIDASALARADAEVALTAESVDLGNLKLGKTRVLATLERSRLVLDLQELRAYEALVTGNFVLNNRSGLSVGGDLAVAGLDLESFLPAAAGITRLTGTADARVKFLGVGQSEQAIMSSLSGEGAFKAVSGVIEGFDLDKLMRRGDATGGTTIFDAMSASFTIRDGILVNDDLAMRLPLARADGKGVVGIGARVIDYRFIPVLLEGENRKGLAIPVRIRGPWANPKIEPDLGKAIDLNLAEQKEKLRQKAADEVRRAVGKELGVSVEEGQSLGDAAKDKLRDEVRKGLKKLFQ